MTEKDELTDMLMSKDVGKNLEEKKQRLFEIIPELKAADGFEQHNPYHIYDVFEHTIRVVENTSNNLWVRLAALFHDAGKPYTYHKDEKGIGHFYGHPLVSKEIFSRVAERLDFDVKTEEVVSCLIECHEKPFNNMKPKKILNLVNTLGEENIPLLLDLRKADIMAQNPEYLNRLEELPNIEERFQQIIEIDSMLKEDAHSQHPASKNKTM